METVHEEEPQPMDVEEILAKPAPPAVEAKKEEPKQQQPASAAVSATKKKKKKASYKSMMAGMMQSSPSRDVEKEKEESIQKVTGGGAFSKIDKI